MLYKTFYRVEIGLPIASNAKLTGLSLAALIGIIVNRLINNNDFKKEDIGATGEFASTK